MSYHTGSVVETRFFSLEVQKEKGTGSAVGRPEIAAVASRLEKLETLAVTRWNGAVPVCTASFTKKTVLTTKKNHVLDRLIQVGSSERYELVHCNNCLSVYSGAKHISPALDGGRANPGNHEFHHRKKKNCLVLKNLKKGCHHGYRLIR